MVISKPELPLEAVRFLKSEKHAEETLETYRQCLTEIAGERYDEYRSEVFLLEDEESQTLHWSIKVHAQPQTIGEMNWLLAEEMAKKDADNLTVGVSASFNSW